MLHAALAIALLQTALGPSPPPAPSPEPSRADPDAPTVGASFDRTEGQIGDRFVLTVSAVARPGLVVTLPKRLELGKFEVLDRDDGPAEGRDLGDGRRVFRFVLGVAAYEVGELELPAIELSYVDQKGEVRGVRTAPLQVAVRGLIADDPQPSVQPLRAPRSAIVDDEQMKRAARYAGIALASIVGLLLLTIFARRYLLRRRKTDVALDEQRPKRPPEEVAMEKIKALREAGNFAIDGYQPFFFAIAEIVREYLGARYGFDSLELTTTELLEELESRAPELTHPDGELVRFLRESDLVKFANVGSSEDAAVAALDAAQAFVLSTSARLEAEKQGAAVA